MYVSSRKWTTAVGKEADGQKGFGLTPDAVFMARKEKINDPSLTVSQLGLGRDHRGGYKQENKRCFNVFL